MVYSLKVERAVDVQSVRLSRWRSDATLVHVYLETRRGDTMRLGAAFGNPEVHARKA